LTPGDSVCEGGKVNINANATDALYYSITVNSADGSDTLNLSEYEYFPEMSGRDTISVQYKSDRRCTVSLDTVITVLPIPDGTSTIPSHTVSASDSVKFMMTSDVDQTSFVWTLDSVRNVDTYIQDSTPPAVAGESASISAAAKLKLPNYPGVATFFIVPKANGCPGSMDTVRIKINPDAFLIFLPEVFTPNGDGFNDTWQIQWQSDINESEYTMHVYNRSGGEVYRMNGLRADWDGGGLPDGVYWWHLFKGSETWMKGAVTIRSDSKR
jgi:gliding motility-associated-like protein